MKRLSREAYLELKEEVRLSDTDRGYHRQKGLLERVEAECSPQQKGAIYRMLAEREEDFMDREARGVNSFGFPL